MKTDIYKNIFRSRYRQSCTGYWTDTLAHERQVLYHRGIFLLISLTFTLYFETGFCKLLNLNRVGLHSKQTSNMQSSYFSSWVAGINRPILYIPLGALYLSFGTDGIFQLPVNIYGPSPIHWVKLMLIRMMMKGLERWFHG